MNVAQVKSNSMTTKTAHPFELDVHVLYPTDKSIVDDHVDPTAYVVIRK